MAQEIYSPELTYTPTVNNHSQVLYRSVNPQGATSVTLGTGVVGSVDFVIPSVVTNLAKSRLNFTLFFQDTAGTRFKWCNANMLTAINRITLYDSATSSILCDVSSVEKFYSMIQPAATCDDEFMTKSNCGNLTGAGSLTLAAAQAITVEDINHITGTNNRTTSFTNAALDVGSQDPYLGVRQFYINTTQDDGNGAGNWYIDVSIPFKAFNLTALALDKQIYSPSNLVLSVYFNPLDNFCYEATSATDPTAGTASMTSGVISNLNVSLATEGNLAVSSQIISKVMSGGGISLPVAFPTVARQNIDTATSQSLQYSLTRGYGDKILCIISSPFYNSGTKNNANVHARGYLTTYNTFINNVPIKYAAGFNCAKSEDYTKANKAYLEGTALHNLGMYRDCAWLHIDSFFNDIPLCKLDMTHIDGLDVSAQSSTWQLQASLSTTQALSWITAIVGQKTLMFTSQGVMVV